MKELNIDYFTLQEMPIPALFVLTKELKKHNDKEASDMKKANKGRK